MSTTTLPHPYFRLPEWREPPNVKSSRFALFGVSTLGFAFQPEPAPQTRTITAKLKTSHKLYHKIKVTTKRTATNAMKQCAHRPEIIPPARLLILGLLLSFTPSCSSFSIIDPTSSLTRITRSYTRGSRTGRAARTSLESSTQAPSSSDTSFDDESIRRNFENFMDDIGESLTNNDELLPAEDDDLDWFRFATIDELYASSPTTNEDTSTNSALERLETSTVAIVGLGGAGAWAAEALCRSGVGHLVLCDLDDICVSQTTNGLNSLKSNVGRFQTEAMKQRLLDIHPAVQVDIIHDFCMQDNAKDVVANLRQYHVDVAIDGMDGVNEKVAFWKASQDHDIRTITMGNSGGKIDPTKVVCHTLDQVHKDGDRLLVNCLQKVPSDLLEEIVCVYSEEETSKGPYGHDNLGEVCFVSGSFGFVAASKTIEILLNHPQQN